ncbi:MAG: hypothetical protein JXB13_19660 [Phycisphaerae bacterium]|nr:hypothetical protein [Phycisphaerae bacterium]
MLPSLASRTGGCVSKGFVVAAACLACAASVRARDFDFESITDAPGGPGQGRAPSINDNGDIAFFDDTTVYLYDRSEGTFLNVTALPGAPSGAWFPKLNNQGNIVMLEQTSRDLWFFEAASQTFTNISALPGYPGNSQAHGLQLIFALNDSNVISFHSGQLNYGDVYVYRHATGTFEMITGKPGGSSGGRENTINNLGQVAYMGFPSLYVYDPATGTTTNISTLPGGPGGLGDSFALNDRGDAALFRPDQVTYYDAASGTFLYVSDLPGFPAGSASGFANDLSWRGEIAFWRTDIYYFNPVDQSFTVLNNQGPVPAGGMESSINNRGRIAFTGGQDVYVAVGAPQSDFDADGDVDLADFALFQSCFRGAGLPCPGCPACPADADLDGDDDVDNADFTVFEGCLNGPDQPAAPPS